MRKVMISHSTIDQNMAEAVSSLLRKCSLNQIEPWFSSDPSFGGIGVGRRWFDQIRDEIKRSSTVIVLLTPNSVNSSWVQFEAGFGAGVAELELVPLVIGFDDLSQVPNPLSHWQVFRLRDHQTASVFIQKILAAFSIAFDNDLVNAAVTKALSDLASIRVEADGSEPAVDEFQGTDLRRYLEAKFFDLNALLAGRAANMADYRIEISNEIEGRMQSLLITVDTSLQSALDEIYFSMQGSVEPFKYLESWVLLDETDSAPIIVREVQDRIPAHFVLPPNHSYKVVSLSEPFKAGARQVGGTSARGRR